MQQEDIAGVIINPWGEPFVLCKSDIALFLAQTMTKMRAKTAERNPSTLEK